YNLKRMYPEYVDAALKAASLTGSPPEEIARRLAIFRQDGIDGFRRDTLRTLLNRAERGQPVSPVTIAGLYNALGEKQNALDWLERAVACGWNPMAMRMAISADRRTRCEGVIGS